MPAPMPTGSLIGSHPAFMPRGGAHPSFDAPLPSEIIKGRKDIAIRAILEKEFPNRAAPSSVTINAPSKTEGTPLGQLAVAGGAGILAPIILNTIMKDSFKKGKLAATLQLLSIPIAALGGATLYSILKGGEKERSPFVPVFPMVEKNKLR